MERQQIKKKGMELVCSIPFMLRLLSNYTRS